MEKKKCKLIIARPCVVILCLSQGQQQKTTKLKKSEMMYETDLITSLF